MSVAIGSVFGLKQETTYATEVTPNVFHDVISMSSGEDNAILTPKTMNNQRALYRVLPGSYNCNGSISMLAAPCGIVPWLAKGLFGQVSSADLTGGAYRHTFTPATSTTPPSLTFYMDKEAGVYLFLGAVVSALKITANVQEAVGLAWDWVARNPKETTVLAATLPTEREMIWSDATITLNSGASTKIENMDFSISQAVQPVFTHDGTRFAGFMVATDFEVGGTLNLEFNDKVQYKRFWGNAAATSPQNAVLTNDLLIAWTSPDQIASSGQYYTIELHIPALVYSSGAPQAGGSNDRWMQALSFVGKYDVASTYPVRLRITNDEASYV